VTDVMQTGKISFLNSKTFLIGRSYWALRRLSFIMFYKQIAPGRPSSI